jgi:2-keto-4-pentenoate hydratase
LIAGTGGSMSDPRIARGMEAQLAQWRRRIQSGERRVGWKIGLNAPFVQEQLGISRAVIGYLTSGTQLAPAASHSLAGGTTVGVEAEIAVHISRHVPAGGDRDTAEAAIGALAPALEVVDIDLPFEDLQRILTENVFHRAAMLGPASSRQPPGKIDDIAARIVRNGSETATANAAAVVGDLAEVVRLVADMLGAFGEDLLEGDRIISGSITSIVWVKPGDRVEADLGPLGALEVGFTD